MPDLEQPIPGEIRFLKRFQGCRNRKCIWIICKECGNGFWLDFYYYKKKYKSGLCISCYRKHWNGKKNPCWRGGEHIDKDGYVWLYVFPDDLYHSMCIKGRNYVKKHRYIMAKNLGRCLKPWEVVHHKDENRQNNKISNLKLLSSQIEHLPSMAIKNYIMKLEKEIKTLENENKKLKSGDR